MASVTIQAVKKNFGEVPILHGVDIDIRDGSFTVLVGPSGCGKSTLLRMIAGLEQINSGEIRIGDRVVNNLQPKERDIAMVFQNYALYPHMTVRQNMAFSLALAKMDKTQADAKVARAAEILALGALLERYPRQLSGGQRQRVAMGRAIVRSPQVFCMDEPLSNLDAKLRVATRTQIASLQRRLAVTTLYVTHDQVEAMTMGDRVAVLKDGILQQVDKPRAMYDRPANKFVAGFIGSPAMNLIDVPVDGDGVHLGTYNVPMPREAQGKLSNGTVSIGMRPEHLKIVGDGAGIPVTVELVEELGSDAFLHGSVEGREGEPLLLVARVDPTSPPERGTSVHLQPVPDQLHWFDAATGLRVAG